MNSGYEPVVRTIDRLYEPWMAWLFVLMLIAITLTRVRSFAFFTLLRNVVFNYRIARPDLIDSEYPGGRDWLIMWIPSVIHIALFFFLAIQSDADMTLATGLQAYLQILLIVFLVFVLKLIVMEAASSLSVKNDLLREYRANTLLFTILTGILLTPLCIGTSLTIGKNEEWIWIIGIAIYLCFYLIRLWRGAISALQQGVRFYYIILYLCTLEILPLAVLIKAWYGVYHI
ncbi:MAG: hypothetical protein RL226_2210 [Bacteroidota bacterium]